MKDLQYLLEFVDLALPNKGRFSHKVRNDNFSIYLLFVYINQNSLIMTKGLLIIASIITLSSCKSIYIDALTSSSSHSKKIECKKFYKDGETFLYYTSNNIAVSAHLSINTNYGKYYTVDVVVENFTGQSFNFNPTDINAILTNKGEKIDGDVFSHNRYMKKVKRSQNWSEALNAFSEGMDAASAGHSTSSTTTAGSSNYNSSSNSYGNSNYNSSGSIYGSYSQTTPIGSAGASGLLGVKSTGASNYTSNKNTSSTLTHSSKSVTNTYDGGANYAAQQNAKQNIKNLENENYQIRNTLNQGYLKLNTIDNEMQVNGYVNIKYKKSNRVKVIIPVNGVGYEFVWDVDKR